MNSDFSVFDDPIILDKEISDIYKFASHLKNTELPKYQIKMGSFFLQGREGITKPIQYSDESFQLLKGYHNYTFPIHQGEVELSLQLYENTNCHYRINCFGRFNNKSGQLFSINLTKEKDAKGSIFLVQKIKFSDRLKGNTKATKAFRQMKQQVFSELLYKLGFDITETNDLLLGIYDTKSETFLNTTSEKFISDFLMISLLKGHFMGNKGYQLEILPTFNLNPLWLSSDASSDVFPEKIQKRQGSRSIPLSLRFKVLERDRCCKLCGRSPKDGITLHIDHIVPYSLGGLTILENLQALCQECNIGKSNKSLTKY
ncbi:HNH endonuclease [Cytobacillus sp. FJAT-54145]|uniref:HNH endonuclease n=1 Tax=Cytobacillus spartinae TaxID=3299023 RepID=A0ABW6K6D1_9BACI